MDGKLGEAKRLFFLVRLFFFFFEYLVGFSIFILVQFFFSVSFNMSGLFQVDSCDMYPLNRPSLIRDDYFCSGV